MLMSIYNNLHLWLFYFESLIFNKYICLNVCVIKLHILFLINTTCLLNYIEGLALNINLLKNKKKHNCILQTSTVNVIKFKKKKKISKKI